MVGSLPESVAAVVRFLGGLAEVGAVGEHGFPGFGEAAEALAELAGVLAEGFDFDEGVAHVLELGAFGGSESAVADVAGGEGVGLGGDVGEVIEAAMELLEGSADEVAGLGA